MDVAKRAALSSFYREEFLRHIEYSRYLGGNRIGQAMHDLGRDRGLAGKSDDLSLGARPGCRIHKNDDVFFLGGRRGLQHQVVRFRRSIRNDWLGTGLNVEVDSGPVGLDRSYSLSKIRHFSLCDGKLLGGRHLRNGRGRICNFGGGKREAHGIGAFDAASAAALVARQAVLHFVPPNFRRLRGSVYGFVVGELLFCHVVARRFLDRAARWPTVCKVTGDFHRGPEAAPIGLVA